MYENIFEKKIDQIGNLRKICFKIKIKKKNRNKKLKFKKNV